MCWVFWFRENVNSFCVNLPGHKWCRFRRRPPCTHTSYSSSVPQNSHDILEQKETSAVMWSTAISQSMRSLRARKVRWFIQQKPTRGWKNQDRNANFLLPGQFSFLFYCYLLGTHGHFREGEKERGWERRDETHILRKRWIIWMQFLTGFGACYCLCSLSWAGKQTLGLWSEYSRTAADTIYPVLARCQTLF